MSNNYLSTLFLGLAIVHTFLISFFAKLSIRYDLRTLKGLIFHWLAEVEIAFILWSLVFLIVSFICNGLNEVRVLVSDLRLTEPIFIFCIILVATAKPVFVFAQRLLTGICSLLSRIIKIDKVLLQFFALLFLGALLGSVITEPAAIALVSSLLLRMLKLPTVDDNFLYAILGVLFVNISVGGGLTSFSAPSVLIVAGKWNWTNYDVFLNLGLAAVSVTFINALAFTYFLRKKIVQNLFQLNEEVIMTPWWIIASNLFFLIAVILNSHSGIISFGLVCLFVVFAKFTKKYQQTLKYRQALTVSLFLASLVTLGSLQSWWVQPLIVKFSEKLVFLGSTVLTAFIDNAAITFIGSQAAKLSNASQWALVAGSLAGGGLTIIANAPNPIGFSILRSKFSNQTLSMSKLFLAAIIPTAVAIICFLSFSKF